MKDDIADTGGLMAAGHSPDGYNVTLPALASGSRIGGYVLESQIGSGGMAVVFRARDEQLDRPVALKLMAAPLAVDDEFRQRFIRESRAAAMVEDPHIIPVYAAGEAGGVLYIVMRLVTGGDLRSLMSREGALSPDRTMDLVSRLPWPWTRRTPPALSTVTLSPPTSWWTPGRGAQTTCTCPISG